MLRDEPSSSDVGKAGAFCRRGSGTAVRGRGGERSRRVGEAEGRRVHLGRPWEDLLWPRFENPQRNERVPGQRGGGGGGPAAKGPKVSPRRDGRPPLPLPPPSGFSAPHHSKIGDRRFLTAFPGAPPVLPGSRRPGVPTRRFPLLPTGRRRCRQFAGGPRPPVPVR